MGDKMNFEDVVSKIRTYVKRKHGVPEDDVPEFDPKNGNEKAKILFLLEAPGPAALASKKNPRTGEPGSGIVSLDNDDPTARMLKAQLDKAGINNKDDIAIWNVVPWYLGNEEGTQIRAATVSDIEKAKRYLQEVVEAMDNLQYIVLVGAAARKTHVFLSTITCARIFSCHHPSTRAMNAHRRAQNIAVFKNIKKCVARRLSANELWNSRNEGEWKAALDFYWSFVKPTHLAVEKEFDDFNAGSVQVMSAEQWYDFLLNKYFFWKYTAPNRYKTTTTQLQKYVDGTDSLHNLNSIKDELFSFDKNDIAKGIRIATKIRGLGVAGASGLLAVLFPHQFATVDQFVVKALRKINGLPEHDDLMKMNPESLTPKNGAVLIKIMRGKAEELNRSFSSAFWTPRRIDMILWGLDR